MFNSGNIEDLLAARRYGYKVIARIFGSEPTQNLSIACKAELICESLRLLSGQNEQAQSLALWLSGPGEDLDNLKGCYNRLFIGPGEPICHPWEAYHIPRTEKRLFSPTALEVRECYRAQSFLPEGYPHVSDDGFALEADFLAVLGNEALTAYTEGRPYTKSLAASDDFLKNHFLRWIESFCESVKKADPRGFYCAAAQFAEGFTQADSQILPLLY